MGEKYPPLSMPDVCAHALLLEREAGLRFREYAILMRELGSGKVASAFDEMAREEDEEVRALQAACMEQPPIELSPAEIAWRRAYLPEGVEHATRPVPRDAGEAVQLSVLAKQRAVSFYNEVADHGRDVIVRNCAAEMASSGRRQIQRLERLLAGGVPDAQIPGPSGGGDANLPR